MAGDDFEAGRQVATLVLDDAPEASRTHDPRTAEFARGALEEFTAGLRGTRGFLRRVVDGAEAAAEDLAVEVFQGLVEVLQNADDLKASEVRIAVRTRGEQRQLLIVHDGEPVTVHHVLAMNLPFLTTKSEDEEKLGRFGIGLKTLGRIATSMDVHGAPYYFAAKGLRLEAIAPADAIPAFYDPERETLLVLDLRNGVSLPELVKWFADWSEDNLLFLRSVRRFRMHDLATGADEVKALEPDDWEELGESAGVNLRRRRVRGSACAWELYAADCPTPANIDRSHKATGATTRISVALASGSHQAGIFIAFRTRVPSTLPFSLDAQFDPTAAREGLIENDWNRWLVARCGDVVAAIVMQRLAEAPRSAWAWAPVAAEMVGVDTQAWPGTVFAEAMASAREAVDASAALRQNDRLIALSDLAYEGSMFADLLTSQDLEALAPGKAALTHGARDAQGRWRKVLSDLKAPTYLAYVALKRGFTERLFDNKPVAWWVDAAAVWTANRTEDEIFGVPCWLAEDGTPVACRARNETDRPLLLGPPLSEFARRWGLMVRLHDAYIADSGNGAALAKWLQDKAAVTTRADPAVELAAFAEVFAKTPHSASDPELQELQRRFDGLTDREAAPVAAKVGAALLLDGYTWRGGRRVEQKVRPDQAYLPRRLDSDYPDWPDAADGLPGIAWISPSYDERLRSGPRGSRKTAEGLISRGPRRFLMLLGVQCRPRVEASEGVHRGGSQRRQRDLRVAGAEYVKTDWLSPDIERVLAQIARAPKKEKRERSAGLVRVLSRYWDRYSGTRLTTCFHNTPKNVYARTEITTHWVGQLQDTPWVAVGTGRLVVPGEAVVKSPETQGYYTADHFIAGVTPEDLRSDFARAMRFITDVRVSDLTRLLAEIRDSGMVVDTARVLQIYRSLAKLCPRSPGRPMVVGDLSIYDLRARFEDGDGLVWIAAAQGTGGVWRRPSALLRGRDIFHEPDRFVPAGPSYQDLWTALGVRLPDLGDCAGAVRRWSKRPASPETDAALIDIYHHMDGLPDRTPDRSLRDRLRALPVVAVDKGWVTGRPVFHVRDRELRQRLATARPDILFWTPPWDVETSPAIATMLGLTVSTPGLTVPQLAAAESAGEALAVRFAAAIDHLSNEFARNDPAARDALTMSWDSLRELPLSVYDTPFEVQVVDPALSPGPVLLQMRAVLAVAPYRLHICADDLAEREGAGRAVASLFAPAARRRVEAEWVVAWLKSTGPQVQMLRMASDEANTSRLQDLAAAAAGAPKTAVKITSTRGKTSGPPPKSRMLKAGHGSIATVTITTGSAAKHVATAPKPLATSAPAPPGPPKPPQSAQPAYTPAQLEQRGWDVLLHVLNTSVAQPLVDFRARRQVGADGVIDWKTFVELKATGGAALSSVELSNNEYERALERGGDFILALVSGLAEGEHGTEVRLILDPARCATMKPVGGVRLSGLQEAPAVVVQLTDAPETAGSVADPV